MRQPKAAEITSARRVGNEVYLTISVPTANVDESTPASVARIDVWAVTAATPPSQSQFTSMGTLVTKIPVARYADPADTSGRVVPNPKMGALQGASVTILDVITPDAEVPRQPPAPAKGTRVPEVPTTTAAAAPEVIRRYYMTIPASDRGRPGPPSMVVEVPMTFVPERVPSLLVAMDGHNVVLEWDPAGGLLGWLLDRAFPMEPAPVEDRQATSPAAPAASAPSGPALYNVYLDIAGDPLVLPARQAADTLWARAPATPINKQPLATLTFPDDVPFDGRQRCYHVRAVRGTGAQRVEGESSDRQCIVPVDTEPPAKPTSLTSTEVEGEIALRWDPNGEEDLVGYVVLRRDEGSDTLRSLTSAPTAEPKYTDSTSLVPGRMYTYLVQAVDNRIPLPNVSDAAEITVTAR